MSQTTVEVKQVEKASKEKLKKSVVLILLTVFFERFCSGGIFGTQFKTYLLNDSKNIKLNSDPRDLHQSKA